MEKKLEYKLWSIMMYVLLLLGIMTSCNKFLDVKPEDRFLDEEIFKNEINVNNALNGIYLNMAKPALYGGQLSMSTVDVMAQYYNSPTAWTRLQLANYVYTDQGVMDSCALIWRSAYTAILNTNSFISKLGPSTHIMSSKNKDILMGEAYALRAFLHFDMLRLFGPVYAKNPDDIAIPYLTAPTEKIQPLLPAKMVIDSVITDLNRAILLLEKDPIRIEGVVPVSGNDPLGDFYKFRNRRLNYYAALGIKARVLLYKGDKKGALDAAMQVIKEGSGWFKWTAEALSRSGIPNPDRNFSSEVLFGLLSYDMYSMQRLFFAETLTGVKILAPTNERLTEFFENNENDYRLRVNWYTGAAAGKAYKTFRKYEDIADKTLTFRNFQPLLRISELYYIVAECTPDPVTAKAYINIVRSNRGLPELVGDVQMETALTNEYRKEFWGEGQMFFYYKRNATASIPGGRNSVTVAMNAAKYVVPLPLSETQNR